MSKAQANPYPLRLPLELMEKFKVIANENGRSLNAEIMMLVKRSVSLYEQEHGEIRVEGDE